MTEATKLKEEQRVAQQVTGAEAVRTILDLKKSQAADKKIPIIDNYAVIDRTIVEGLEEGYARDVKFVQLGYAKDIDLLYVHHLFTTSGRDTLSKEERKSVFIIPIEEARSLFAPIFNRSKIS